MSRADAARHRVVPCFLERGAAQREDIPYGLRLKHGVSLEEAGGLKQVAEKLATVGRQPSDARADGSGVLDEPELLATATTAFLGQTTRGPVGRAMLLNSWAEYQRVFGAHIDPKVSFLSYAVKGFFDNGGHRAYVVRVVGAGSSLASARFSASNGEGLVFRTTSVGAWGNSLRVRIEPGTRLGLRIQVFCDRADQGPELLEDYDNLSPDPNNRRFYLAEFNTKSDHLRAEPTSRFESSAMPPNVELRLCAGTYGPAPSAADYIGESDVDCSQRTGLAALGDVADISFVCIPDHVHPSVEAIEQSQITDALIEYCERLGDCFAILSVRGGLHATALLGPRDSATAAMYYPWVRVRTVATGEAIFIPAVGHVAGAYAKSDLKRGVHTSPAGGEICGLEPNPKTGNSPLEFEVAADDIDRLQRMGINAIQSDGNQVRMSTAITTSVDDGCTDLAAQRLVPFIRKSIRVGTMWALFEPNDEDLWTQLRSNVAEFLRGVWERGALAGRTAEEAFFVRCGRDTMTEDDIENRRIVLLIGLSLPSSSGLSTLIFTIHQAW